MDGWGLAFLIGGRCFVFRLRLGKNGPCLTLSKPCHKGPESPFFEFRRKNLRFLDGGKISNGHAMPSPFLRNLGFPLKGFGPLSSQLLDVAIGPGFLPE